MKKTYLLFLMLLLPLLARAAAVEIGGIYYNLNAEAKTAEVTSNPNKYSEAVIIPSSVTEGGNTYAVTGIDDQAFYECTGLTELTIPTSIVYIGKTSAPGSANVFRNCNENVFKKVYISDLEAWCRITFADDFYANPLSIAHHLYLNDSEITDLVIPNTITTLGTFQFASCHGLTSLTIPESVKNLGLATFYDCRNISSVSIAPGITSIGVNMFNGCNNLTSVNIPNTVATIGNSAFSYCTNLQSVTIPSSVTSIGESSFYCSSLSDVYCLAEDVPQTHTDAFNNTTIGNVTLHVPAGSADAYKAVQPWSGFKEVVAIATTQTVNVATAGTLSTLIASGEKDYIENLTITGNLNGADLRFLREMAGSDYNGVPTDGKLSYLDMSGATIVAGENYVELVDEKIIYDKEIGNYHGGFDKEPQVSVANTLGKYVFAGCSKLETVKMPMGVINVGERAFSDTNLKNIVWPTSLATIGIEAFFDCKFTSFTLPASVESIAGNILRSCSSLTELSVESGNTEYDSRDNCNALIETSTNTLITGCNNSTIPDGVTSIGNYAFYYCSDLTSVSIGSGVTSIGAWSFGYCSSLTSLTLPASVVDLGTNDPFTGCSSLESIVVESGNPKFDSRNGCNAIIETSTNSLLLGCKNTVIPNDVTSIGNRAFDSCIGLISLTIPGSVNSIGMWAFRGCSGLADVFCNAENVPTTNVDPNYPNPFIESNITNATLHVLASSVETYQAAEPWSGFHDIVALQTNIPNFEVLGVYYNLNEETLTAEVTANPNKYSGEVFIPNGIWYESRLYNVTSIGEGAFAYCPNLTSVALPNSLISIGGSAFAYCEKLESVTIPASVTSIVGTPFYGCKGLSSIQVENGNTKFDSRDNCNAIIETASNKLISGCKSTVIPNTVTSIGEWAFMGISDMTSITIPEGTTTIGGWAFGYTSLTSLTIPASVTSIGNDAFSVGSSLTTIEVAEGNTKYDSRDNCKAIIETSTNSMIRGCKNTVIPASVTTIGYRAFYRSGITDITIPTTISSIETMAFEECGDLESIQVADGNTKYDSRDNCNAIIETASNTLIAGCKNSVIPNSVTSIGERAFCGNASTTISIPSSVTTIDNLAFYGNNELTDVYCSAVNVPTTGTDVFDNVVIANVTLHVPASSIETYSSTAPWSGFKEIVAISTEKTVNVTTAGTLSTLIADGEKNFIESLTITGNLNGADLRFLREMAGSDYNGVPTDGNLSFLDMSGATIVAGGNYVELVDGKIVYDKEIGNYHGGFDKEPQVSVANTLGKYVFAGCSKLETVKMPTGVINVGERAFSDTNLKNIVWPTSLATIGIEAFFDCKFTSFTLPASVENFGTNILRSCRSLTELSVESGNTKYDSRDNCNALIEKASNTLLLGCKNTTIPNSVTAIGDGAFSGCSGLISLAIPSSVTTIGKNAFHNCTGLTSISIGSGVTSIGSGAFAGCSNVTSIVVDNGNMAYDSRDNCNAIIEKSTNNLIAGCNNSTIPDGVTAIGDGAFQGCTGITSLIIPNSVTTIGDCAFDNCTGLTSLTLSEKLTSIGNWSFYGIGITSLTIPNSVTTIGEQAFYQCRNLTSATIGSGIKEIGWLAFGGSQNYTYLYCYAEAVPKADETHGGGFMAFDNSSLNATLHVPAGSVDAYKAVEPWKNFKEIVGDIGITITPFSGTDMWAGYVAKEDLALTEGLTAYTISAISNTTATATSLDYIPKEVPVLLKRSDTSVNSFLMTPGTGTAPSTNLLKVYATDKTVSNREGYVLYKDEFVLVNEGTLPAGRIFLPLNGGNAAATRGIVIEGEGTTGIIQNSISDSEVSHREWYDLQGRKLDVKPTKKGVYILNGRKVVVK